MEEVTLILLDMEQEMVAGNSGTDAGGSMKGNAGTQITGGTATWTSATEQMKGSFGYGGQGNQSSTSTNTLCGGGGGWYRRCWW